MALIVQKYGGSSLATPEKIKMLAERIITRYDSGDRLVIVVSAMGQTTNELEAKAHAVSSNPTPREMDMLVSIGERESISLMAIAINSIRPELAVSFTGSQIGLITDNNHGNARILEIKGDRLADALKAEKIPIIAGFQGVSTNKEITTLGRGGSDTTAVAVTSALKADMCEIYSDVAGVYSTDPKLCSDAVLISELDYDTMLTISSLGAKVLKDAAVEYAHRLGVKITTGLTWTGETGTVISDTASLDRNKFAALVYNDNLSYKYCDFKDEILDRLSEVRFFQRSAERSLLILNGSAEGYNQCCSLSIVGSGIRSCSDTLKKMLDITGSAADIISFDISDLKFEIFVKDSLGKGIVSGIHRLFF